VRIQATLQKMSLTQISRGRNPADGPSAALARLDSVQFGLVFRNLPQIIERQRPLDPFAQVAAIERNPPAQQFGAIISHVNLAKALS